MTEDERTVFRLTLASSIAKMRLNRGYSLSDLSKLSGVRESTIKRIEESRFSPNLELIYDIIRAMSYNISFIDEK